MIYVVNGRSHGGVGRKRFERVRPKIALAGDSAQAVFPESVEESDVQVRDAVARGERLIVAAGGDGTVNSVLNALMDPSADRAIGDVVLGGIGLGSSNDFHKPFDKKRFVDGLPVSVSEASRAIDIGKAVYRDPEGKTHQRYFILNASVGIVAEGNAFFNEGDRMVQWLKKIHTEAAIIYSALVNIARFKAVEVEVSLDGGAPAIAPLMNLGVLKRPHFAGGMKYDTPVTLDDGYFDVNTWEPMGRGALLSTIAGLYSGKFSGRPHTRCERAKVVKLRSETPLHLELDGEIVTVTEAELRVVPKAIQVCA